MRRPLWILAVVAFLLIVGGTWLATILWKSTAVGASSGPHLVGALLGAVTLRWLDRRARYLAPIAALAWIGLQLVVTNSPEGGPVSASQHPWLLVAAPACAAVAALIPLPASEARLRWFWTSALLTLGWMFTPLVIANTNDTPGLAIAVTVFAPLVAGGLTQYFATYWMPWTCGSGSLMFAMLLIQLRLERLDRDTAFGVLIGVGAYTLVGAAGAWLAWRLFRHQDPRKAPTALPRATAS